MKLKPNARDWHRWWSMRWTLLAVAYTAAAGAWATIPADWRPDLGEWPKIILAAVGVLIPALAAMAHVVERGKRDDEDETDTAGA